MFCNPALYSAEFYSNQKQPQYTKVADIHDDINVYLTLHLNDLCPFKELLPD